MGAVLSLALPPPRADRQARQLQREDSLAAGREAGARAESLRENVGIKIMNGLTSLQPFIYKNPLCECQGKKESIAKSIAIHQKMIPN
jgi:hypothetical protein